MANPISIVQSIISSLLTLKEMVGSFHSNEEDCSRIRRLVRRAQAVVEPLKQTPMIMENKGMSAALKGLDKALRRSCKVVESCKKKNAISRRIQSKDIAGHLRRVYEDISANMVLVDLANGVNNTSMLTDIMESLADLRARDAYGSMLDKILEIIAAHPDVHLRQEVEKLVCTYRSSTESANRSEDNNEKDDVLAAEITSPHASLSDGSAESTSAKSVTGKYTPCIARKVHRSNATDGAGSSKKKESIYTIVWVPDSPHRSKKETKIKTTGAATVMMEILRHI